MNRGKHPSEETRRKRSEALKGKPHHWKTSGMTGKHHSEETIRKIREKLKGKPLTWKTTSGMAGKHHTEETKMKMREAHTGKHLSEETKKKLSEINKGKPTCFLGHRLSKKHRDKIGKSNKGRTSPNKGKIFSEETREKMRESRKRYFLMKEANQPKNEPHKTRYVRVGTRKKMSDTHKNIPIPEALRKMCHYGYYIQVNGQPFKSIAEVARTYDLDYQRLLKCLSHKRKGEATTEDLDRYIDLSEFGLEYDYETSTVFKRRWGEYLEKELEERPYRKDEITFIVLNYKAKN